MNGVRVLPLLVFAGLSLFALKAAGLFLSGGYVLSGVAPASAQNPQAEETREQAGATQPETQDASRPEPAGTPNAGNDAEAVTAGAPEAAKTADGAETPDMDPNTAAADKQAMPAGDGKTPPETDAGTAVSDRGATKSELAVLEGLANRRKSLDQRARDLDLRENLLKAAEMRVEARITELKEIEALIETELQTRDDHREAQYERLVKMYSGMKPKDAARVFERLQLDVLTGLAAQMKPRVMSAILAEMAPAAAQRLTLEIANLGKPQPLTVAPLPKIESRPAQ